MTFSASSKIAKVLGQTGINIMTRLMGLILAALAVAAPARPDAAQPVTLATGAGPLVVEVVARDDDGAATLAVVAMSRHEPALRAIWLVVYERAEAVLAEVVAGTAIFRILIRSDAALDDAWVEEMVELITERWPAG